MSNELTEIDEVVTSSQEEETTQRDPVLDWFLTHCHLHKYFFNLYCHAKVCNFINPFFMIHLFNNCNMNQRLEILF